MPANRVHHGPTVDVPWDGPAEEAKLASPVTRARGNGMYAWHDANGNDPDGDGYPDAKADSKFPHHVVDTSGNPGDANVAGCRAIKQRVGGSSIPEADKAGVEAHAQAHMDDHQQSMTGATDEGPALQVISPRSMRYVSARVYDHPWAISGGPTGDSPRELKTMAEILHMRGDGLRFSVDEIEDRLAAAKAQNGDRTGGAIAGSVAVIPLYGLISQRESLMSAMSGGTSIDELRSLLRTALADPAIQAVVFDIDSPGGSVDGVPEFAAELRQLRSGPKPIVGQVNVLAASAAYWLAAQMTEVVATPSGEVGSIGVFAMHEDVSRAEDMAGVTTTFISAGPYKTEGNSFEPLTTEARAAIQDQVDTFYSMFIDDVARGRATTTDTVLADYGQGRTLLARKAKAAGMVDRIDTLEATVRRLEPKATGVHPAAAVIPLNRAAIAASIGHPDPEWNRRMARTKGKTR